MAFYRKTMRIEVLSEEPLGSCLSLGQIDYAISEGDCVGRLTEVLEETVTPKQCANLLYEFGSEPGFFQLNDDGKTIE